MDSACCACSELDSGAGRDTTWLRVGIALALAGQGMVFGLGYSNAQRSGEAPAYGSTVYALLHGALIVSALAVIALLGPELFRSAWRRWKARQISVESLFLVTMLGALAGSLISSFSGQGSVYYEVVGVVLCIYTVGRKVGAGTREMALREATRVREDFAQAYVSTERGNRRRVAVAELKTGVSVVEVAPGEPITVDGRIVEGSGQILETAFSGELTPVPRVPGDAVSAGSYSVDAQFRIRVERGLGERTIDRILRTVEEASLRPSQIQVEADRLMRWFVPAVVSISAVTWLVWQFAAPVSWWKAVFNAMAVLLVACPCALGLATPIAVWSGMLTLSRRGLISRSGQLLDGLAEAKVWFFDKTGTLSSERLKIRRFELLTGGLDEQWIKTAVASIEATLSHPIAKELAHLSGDRLEVRALKVLPGGVVASVEGKMFQIGRPDWVFSGDVRFSVEDAKMVVGVAVDDQPVAAIILDEALRQDTEKTLDALRLGGARCRVLSGDPNPSIVLVGGIPVEGNLSPEAKIEAVRRAMREGPVVFVGDGVNDAGAIASASCGIAMGQGALLTQTSADAVLLGDDLSVIPWAVEVAREIRARLRFNLRFALLYNGIGISLAALGWLHPVVAALLMLGSSALVSWRAAGIRKLEDRSVLKVSETNRNK